MPLIFLLPILNSLPQKNEILGYGLGDMCLYLQILATTKDSKTELEK